MFPSNQVTWLKAQPTFAGLKQVCYEPKLRCFIGPNPRKREHISDNPTKYMRELRIYKIEGSALDEYWFDQLRFELNPGLIAIIGNKGSGKSALADILALAGNSHCQQMEFLNSRRFRHAENKASHFRAALSWMDGTEPSDVGLAEDADLTRPERVRYLPQQFIENLCNEIDEGDETSFNQELKKVIFSHVQPADRLQKANLDELISYRVEGFRKAIAQIRTGLQTINEEVVRVETETAKETVDSYRTELSLKQAELDAHDKSKPTDVPAPPLDRENPEETRIAEALAESHSSLADLTKKLDTARAERTEFSSRRALLARIAGHLQNFEDSYAAFVESVRGDFEAAGLDVRTTISISVNREKLLHETEVTTDRLSELSSTINGSAASKGLEAQLADAQNAARALRSQLDAPQERYQQYLADLARWQTRRTAILGSPTDPGSIEFLRTRIEVAETALPQRLVELKIQRTQRVRDIHTQLTRIRDVYDQLYRPVQVMAATGEFSEQASQLHFDTFLSAAGFSVNFLDFIHRNRRGNFYGEVESATTLDDLLARADFNSEDGVVAFLDQIMTLLTVIGNGDEKQPIAIASQLKQGKKIGNLYDFIFGLEYIEPRYTLRLGNKPIARLSPGEKGALLLVFYLLLDREETPIIIDQPEQNLDNESVVKLLVGCIRKATERRQVIIVTHNPNLAVVCDADQLICMSINKSDKNRITFSSGAIEDSPINRSTVDLLEGTYPAFDNRRKKYHKPVLQYQR